MTPAMTLPPLLTPGVTSAVLQPASSRTAAGCSVPGDMTEQRLQNTNTVHTHTTCGMRGVFRSHCVHSAQSFSVITLSGNTPEQEEDSGIGSECELLLAAVT